MGHAKGALHSPALAAGSGTVGTGGRAGPAARGLRHRPALVGQIHASGRQRHQPRDADRASAGAGGQRELTRLGGPGDRVSDRHVGQVAVADVEALTADVGERDEREIRLARARPGAVLAGGEEE